MILANDIAKLPNETERNQIAKDLAKSLPNGLTHPFFVEILGLSESQVSDLKVLSRRAKLLIAEASRGRPLREFPKIAKELEPKLAKVVLQSYDVLNLEQLATMLEWRDVKKPGESWTAFLDRQKPLDRRRFEAYLTKVARVVETDVPSAGMIPGG